jgi:hypothetical protein
MIRIAITAEAFEALAAMLPIGNVGFEREPDANGGRLGARNSLLCWAQNQSDCPTARPPSSRTLDR